jgi:hypothetical protein
VPSSSSPALSEDWLLVRGEAAAAEVRQRHGPQHLLPGLPGPQAPPASVHQQQLPQQQGQQGQQGQLLLTQLLLYPIKSCGAQQASSWPLGPTGLLYDRQWALLDEAGSLLTQKRCPALAQLRPTVDLLVSTSLLLPLLLPPVA